MGKRLAYMALAKTYGVKGIVSAGPSYKSMEVKDGSVILSFNDAPDGFSRLSDMEGLKWQAATRCFILPRRKYTTTFR